MASSHLGTLCADHDSNVIQDAGINFATIKVRDVIVFVDFEKGLRQAGPVVVDSVDPYSHRILLTSSVKVSKGDLIVKSGRHCETKPFVDTCTSCGSVLS